MKAWQQQQKRKLISKSESLARARTEKINKRQKVCVCVRVGVFGCVEFTEIILNYT